MVRYFELLEQSIQFQIAAGSSGDFAGFIITQGRGGGGSIHEAINCYYPNCGSFITGMITPYARCRTSNVFLGYKRARLYLFCSCTIERGSLQVALIFSDINIAFPMTCGRI